MQFGGLTGLAGLSSPAQSTATRAPRRCKPFTRQTDLPHHPASAPCESAEEGPRVHQAPPRGGIGQAPGHADVLFQKSEIQESSLTYSPYAWFFCPSSPHFSNRFLSSTLSTPILHSDSPFPRPSHVFSCPRERLLLIKSKHIGARPAPAPS